MYQDRKEEGRSKRELSTAGELNRPQLKVNLCHVNPKN
ncbi:hypothetical protein HNP25_002356 [Arcicella rosea]|uniref:Uncharacterized protein n=1 Tax=Arcicella rosea TaxID=502909 RepID=A0A841ESQ1_9BACT|nr:hypothetical protein [Arcicella rosea]